VHIVVDARPASFPLKTGIGHYTMELIRWLPRVATEDRFIAWYLDALGEVTRGDPFGPVAAPNLDIRRTRIPSRIFEQLSERFDLPRVEWLARFDVLFAPNFVPPPTRSGRVVLTIHDLAFRRFPVTAPQATRRWLRRLDEALERAAAIIAVSECTRRDLAELYHVPLERIDVIPHGVDHEAFRPVPQETLREALSRLGIKPPYLLYLGGIEPRKNLPRLVEAFSQIGGAPGASLVIAGAGVAWNPEGWAGLRPVMDTLPVAVRKRIVLTGYVSEPDKVALLTGASALAYPSLYEGFGMPVLEAMSVGTPVVASNASAIPEVAGEAAVLVDPYDVSSISGGLETILADGDRRARLSLAGRERAARFRWEATAKETMRVIRRAAGFSRR